ncbi:MAG: hypothetical protein KAS32_24135 [Candidatus Peribacteraceae bacterium]|nr:hypothetical protein [Candidatus Peribacteraceae bacterium]
MKTFNQFLKLDPTDTITEGKAKYKAEGKRIVEVFTTSGGAAQFKVFDGGTLVTGFMLEDRELIKLYEQIGETQ